MHCNVAQNLLEIIIKKIVSQMATSKSVIIESFSLLPNIVFMCLVVSWFGKKFLKQKYVRIWNVMY